MPSSSTEPVLTSSKAGAAPQSRSAPTPRFDRAARLQAFLTSYWLRPENAFWMTIRSEMLSRVVVESPSLDMCCGDGVFSFLHFGGTFAPAFDVFLGADPQPTGGPADRDMFDHVVDAYRPPITRRPDAGFETGVDHKPSLLEKARRLAFYRSLLTHDANERTPFADGTFSTIYCNSAYWISQIDGFLSELGRILRPGGRIVLHIKLDSFRAISLDRHAQALGRRFLERINGGRLDNWPTLADEAVWQSRFDRAGLIVSERTPFITATHVQVWEVGLRPIAPMLIRMSRALDPDSREAIKRDWVALFHDLALPLCDPGLNLSHHDSPAEVQYVLSRA